MKTTKTGKLFYEELVRPMMYLAERNKKMSAVRMNKIRTDMVNDMMIMQKRGIPKFTCK